VDKSEDEEEHKRRHTEAKKDLIKEPSRLYVEAKDLKKETIQESEDIQEAILRREGKNNEHFGDKLREKPKSMHMEAKKNVVKEKM